MPCFGSHGEHESLSGECDTPTGAGSDGVALRVGQVERATRLVATRTGDRGEVTGAVLVRLIERDLFAVGAVAAIARPHFATITGGACGGADRAAVHTAVLACDLSDGSQALDVLVDADRAEFADHAASFLLPRPAMVPARATRMMARLSSAGPLPASWMVVAARMQRPARRL